MLALMPQSPPLGAFYTPTMGTSTTSLTLLSSSPMTYDQKVVPTLLPPAPSPSRRPKLSLNTSNANPVYGRGSTSLNLETLSAISPTARNTFSNGQNRDRKGDARSTKRILTPLTTNIMPLSTSNSILTPSSIPLPASADVADITLSPAASTTSISTIDSLPSEAPYKLPFTVSSILTYGPIPRTRSRTTSFAQSRPMFPAPKKVAFHTALTEDINTTKYTMRHSDIESLSPWSPISPARLSVSEENSVEEVGRSVTGTTSLKVDSDITGSPLAGSKRESEDEEEDGDSVPQTPVAGRRKRHRQWVWTLGPISQGAETSGAGDAEVNMRST